VAARILRIVGRFVDDRRLGPINGAQGSYQIFPDDPKKVRIPDVSFTRIERLPAGTVEEGHGKIAPDLVVEVMSPTDYALDVFAKVHDFLNAGVALIWVANPDTREVFVYRSDGTRAILRSGDMLDGGDVLPDFQCPVADLFTI
jgi:Uma2 family endonuclease